MAARKLIISVKSSWIMAVIPLLVLVGCKQNVDQSTTGVMGEEEVQITIDEVQRAVSTFNKVMVNPTAELMETLCSEELTYGHSSGLIQNRDEFIDDLVNGPFDFLTLEAADQTIHISGNTAIVRHIFLAKGTNAGEAVDVRIGNMQVYQKGKDGKLRLLARQAYKLPN
ncbi:nuclear transport factor 2 family protein [Arenibacter sp. S6351L]|uniref:nuclear transport factor 2 family protein n=1 Tax=Arenibacter sp. S6351L TaxID=2926407 RepID=UPI001FF0E10D|nr:nuclear transport factor 2 family protein [Arenibacter sp. S6351L]MCK0133342.1 nuclear transport factor 2 family protein [Arenibacter sp. S6351L]